MRTRFAGTTEALLEWPFLLACVVLGIAAFGISPVLMARGGMGVKEPLPLRRPLGKLAQARLGPYRWIAREQRILPAAVEDELGATDYIDWQFEDTTIEDARDPVSHVRLFVTYYTGGRNLVPHTPDVCYLGQGYEPTEKQNLDIEVDTLGETIPIRALTFERSAIFGQDRPTVVYTFHCNGDFAATRTAVRYRINAPQDRHAYFCKIELTFGSQTSVPHNATRAESVEAAKKFLNYILPPLLNNHLPDWEAARQASQVAASVAS